MIEKECLSIKADLNRNFFAECPAHWKQILQRVHLNGNVDFYHKFYQPLMQERIKTIITTSWSAAVDQTEKNIREVFGSNTILSPGMCLFLFYFTVYPNMAIYSHLSSIEFILRFR